MRRKSGFVAQLNCSTNLPRLFCWPCLLFAQGKSQTWTRKRYAVIRCFHSDCRKHERSNCHLEAYKKWKTFDAIERVDPLFMAYLYGRGHVLGYGI